MACGVGRLFNLLLISRANSMGLSILRLVLGDQTLCLLSNGKCGDFTCNSKCNTSDFFVRFLGFKPTIKPEPRNTVTIYKHKFSLICIFCGPVVPSMIMDHYLKDRYWYGNCDKSDPYFRSGKTARIWGANWYESEYGMLELRSLGGTRKLVFIDYCYNHFGYSGPYFRVLAEVFPYFKNKFRDLTKKKLL